MVYVGYRGRVTVGSSVRARLCGRDQDFASLVWEALAQAGWLGQKSGIRSSIEVSIRVSPAPGPHEPLGTGTARQGPRIRRRGHRREGEVGRITEDGTVHQRYEGVPHPRWVSGIWFVESERRAEDFDYLEDMLYTAAVRAGWLVGDADPEAVAEVPHIDIIIGTAPYDPGSD